MKVPVSSIAWFQDASFFRRNSNTLFPPTALVAFLHTFWVGCGSMKGALTKAVSKRRTCPRGKIEESVLAQRIPISDTTLVWDIMDQCSLAHSDMVLGQGCRRVQYLSQLWIQTNRSPLRTRRRERQSPNCGSSKAVSGVSSCCIPAVQEIGTFDGQYSYGRWVVWTQVCGFCRPIAAAVDITAPATDLRLPLCTPLFSDELN